MIVVSIKKNFLGYVFHYTEAYIWKIEISTFYFQNFDFLSQDFDFFISSLSQRKGTIKTQKPKDNLMYNK